MYTFPPPTLGPHPLQQAQTAALEAHAAQMGSFARRLGAQAVLVAEQARRMEEEQRARTGAAGAVPPFLFERQEERAALEWARLLHSGHSSHAQPHSHPLSAHAQDHARTKAELSRRREEERLRALAAAERARRQQEAEERVLAQAWEGYEARWAELALLSPTSPGASGTVGMGFSDLPWPCSPAPSSPADLSPIKVQRFILSPSHSPSLGPKERVRQALLRWHPDKFEGRWMRRCREGERQSVREGVLMVVNALGEVQEEMSRRGVWSP
ncbi:hypothetical protein CALCODRAFT_481443 [Calocera cornea HHB12733]|uniref:Uncharacterized protein n=1 Tax=Calocera cornea HHB12733 TaxID=1353952 RepID=A0A165HP95_9BASI|nr:hypothetical protein CALCODRAFT_481443 [Calocera cornea HHB12733]